jgi:hypothetical protein
MVQHCRNIHSIEVDDEVRNNIVKGTVSRDGFGFWWHVRLVLGPNRGQGHFRKFLGAPMILYCKKVYFSWDSPFKDQIRIRKSENSELKIRILSYPCTRQMILKSHTKFLAPIKIVLKVNDNVPLFGVKDKDPWQNLRIRITVLNRSSK